MCIFANIRSAIPHPLFHDSDVFPQYRKYLPSQQEFSVNAARARLRFACTAILESVRERRRRWTWAYFAERRDDRSRYVELFQKKNSDVIAGEVSEALRLLS